MGRSNCPDCGAPVGEDRLPLGDCWLYGQMVEQYRREGREKTIKELAGGGDPPCIHYNYVYGQEQLQLSRRRWGCGWFFVLGVPAVIVVASWLLR